MRFHTFEAVPRACAAPAVGFPGLGNYPQGLSPDELHGTAGNPVLRQHGSKGMRARPFVA